VYEFAVRRAELLSVCGVSTDQPLTKE